MILTKAHTNYTILALGGQTGFLAKRKWIIQVNIQTTCTNACRSWQQVLTSAPLPTPTRPSLHSLFQELILGNKLRLSCRSSLWVSPVNETMVCRKHSETTHKHTQKWNSDDSVIPEARLLHEHNAAAGYCLCATPQRSTQRWSHYHCLCQEQLSPLLHLRDVYTDSRLWRVDWTRSAKVLACR